MIHLCSAWLWWPRFDAAGRLSPFYAEQIDAVCRAAGRHGLFVHLAVSHYPLGLKSPPYAQYLEAGYQASDYNNPQSKFFGMFTDYLAQLAEVFRDDTVLSSFTPAGEGDPACGMQFVNMVHDALTRHDGNHLVMAEPHHQVTQHPNYYRQAGWKPRWAGCEPTISNRSNRNRPRASACNSNWRRWATSSWAKAASTDSWAAITST